MPGPSFSEKIGAQFLDGGGAAHNVLHPMFDPSGSESRLERAISVLGATDARLILPPGTINTLSASTTIPANIVLDPCMGTVRTAGFRLIVSRMRDPGNLQVFDTSAGGAVALADASIVRPEWWGAKSDGAADDHAPLAAAWDNVRDEGGTMELRPSRTYRCDSALDLRNIAAGKRRYPRTLEGNGATLDFSRAGLTSGGLVTAGADVLAHASETVWSEIRNLLVAGPENATDILPRTARHRSDASAATSVVGLSLENALNWNVRNVFVDRCYEGFRFELCWGGVYENLRANRCVIGHHYDQGCTYILALKPEATHCTQAYLFRPTRISAALGVITIQSPRAEDCTIGFHLDPNAETGNEIHSIQIRDPYMENVYSDAFRVGIAFDSTPANWVTRGTDRGGKIVSFMVEGGRFVGDGVTAGWGAQRKAFVFASTQNLLSGRLVFTCAISDTVDLPPHVSFQSLVRGEDSATQPIDSLLPGQAIGRIGSSGESLFVQGNIFTVSHAGTGLYDVNFRKPYTSADAAIAIVTARASSHYAAVDDAASTASSVRVQIRTDAGVAADAAFHILVHGQLAPL